MIYTIKINHKIVYCVINLNILSAFLLVRGIFNLPFHISLALSRYVGSQKIHIPILRDFALSVLNIAHIRISAMAGLKISVSDHFGPTKKNTRWEPVQRV